MDVYRISNLLLFVIISILSLIKEGMGIECYTCNSQKHKACDTFSSMSKEARIPYITKCWQLDDSDVKNYTMCRKIVQDVEGDERIIRQCATAGTPGHPCTTRTGTRKIKMKYCECEKDLCNVASRNFRLPLQTLGLSLFICLFGILII